MMISHVAAIVLAGSNSPERALERTKTEVLLKLNLRCGTALTLEYDGDSLRAHNQDIRFDQTDGDLECNEPLRYLWALCGSDSGKAAVKKAELQRVVCKGTPSATGSLRLKAGTLTVERAFEEAKSFLRARAEFEKALKVKVVAEEDPYGDEAWRAFRREPNPVLSTTDYCLVDGGKVEFDWSIIARASSGTSAKTVKCLEAGKVVIDVTLDDRKPTGLVTDARDDFRRRVTLKQGKRDGLEERFEKGALESTTEWKLDERVSSREFFPSKKLKRAWRQLPAGQASVSLTEDGRVAGLSCLPGLEADDVLSTWCGFRGEKTVEVFDGTGKLNHVVTYKNGLKTQQRAGDSQYASGRTVRFVEGKEDGEERLTRPDGTLEATVTWRRGQKHGVERRYSDDGKKVIEEKTWADDTVLKRVTFFLNGNPETEETVAGERKKVTEFFDLGGVRFQGESVSCSRGRWCDDGVHRWNFEGGAPWRERRFEKGALLAEQTWFQGGGRATNATFVKGRLATQQRFFADGGLEADEAFEADGSRKR